MKLYGRLSSLGLAGIFLPVAGLFSEMEPSMNRESLPFSPHLYFPGLWVPEGAEDLRMHVHYIAGPAPGEDREEWIRALRLYRQSIRDGTGNAVARLRPNEGAWMNTDAELAKAYDFRPGETVRITVEARSLAPEPASLAVTFNVFHRREGAWAAWPIPAGSIGPIPSSREWETVSQEICVPDFDDEKYLLHLRVGAEETGVDIRYMETRVADGARMAAVEEVFAAAPPGRGVDLSSYDRPDLEWVRGTFTANLAFMYDLSFYDPAAGKYSIDEYLDDGELRFGGYDVILLWHGYPRFGFDDRNQFDFYRDMPGGLEALRDLCRRARERGVKVLINYNPWDIGTRREPIGDEESLAEIVAGIEADGIFLDTMAGGSQRLREEVDRRRSGIVFDPEAPPAIHHLGMSHSSWAQRFTDPDPPGILHLKWIEPRHLQRQIRRWDKSHQAEIETAFFNGSGMMIWENVFGSWNPWREEDAAVWRRAVPILRHFTGLLSGDSWEPFYPTEREKLFANRWSSEGIELFHLLNHGDPIDDAPLLAVPRRDGFEFHNLWTGEPLQSEDNGDATLVTGSIDRIGAILAIHRSRIDAELLALLDSQRNLGSRASEFEERTAARSVIDPLPVAPTERVASAPPGMVRVEESTIVMRIEHLARECNCYPDPGTPPERWHEFLERHFTDLWMRHEIGPLTIPAFFIDEAQVTNADYRRFLDESGYEPRHPENFLKHWPDGEMPGHLADHPVVWVDLDDARAYAAWAGKRLPTEPEWHLAAQGTDGRKWPWGDELDPALYNSGGAGTMPVRSLPEGRSPWGCYHMSGNVWEWTESERSDGHTRFAMLRGGSYYKAEGSVWYADGGPQPCDHHAKYLLMHPGLDRSATIGFRCVKDAVD